jgi:hypothetical protein
MNVERKNNKPTPKEIYARYKGFCATCHYTIWQGERIWYDGRAKHLDCRRAILDNTPRVVDDKYIHILGKLNRKKMKAALAG